MAPEAQTGKQPTPALLFDTFNAFQRTQALKTAIELELFTAIGEGNTTAKAIAERCGGTERDHPHPLRFSHHRRFLNQARQRILFDARLGDVPRQTLAGIHGHGQRIHPVALHQGQFRSLD